MTWATLAPILVSVATAVGAAELLKLLVTRRSRHVGDTKVQADTEVAISGELRQWTTQAEARARAAETRADKAEERAEQTEIRLQTRLDDVCNQLVEVRREVERMRLLIRDCTAGSPCPVRIAIDARPT